ncbi:hypothetical protein THAOC_12391, partial [Thalassiosira oceanica]
MIEQTTQAEAASSPNGDDNGPGSEEPPPHDLFRFVYAGLRRPSESRALPTFPSTIYHTWVWKGTAD